MAGVPTFRMLFHSGHTTNSFEATTTTEAGLLVLVTALAFFLKQRKKIRLDLRRLVSGRLAGFLLQNKVAKMGGLFQ